MDRYNRMCNRSSIACLQRLSNRPTARTTSLIMSASPTTAQLYRQYFKTYKQLLQHTERINNTKKLPDPYKWSHIIKDQLRSKQITTESLIDYTTFLQCTVAHSTALKDGGWGLQNNTTDQIAATARYVGLSMPKVHKD